MEEGSKGLEHKANLFFEAAEAGSLDEVKALLAAGLDVDARNEYGETALMWAAVGGNLELIEYLLASGCDVDAENCKSTRALMYAAMRGMDGSLRCLLKAGCEVDGVDYGGDGASALMYAARRSSYDAPDGDAGGALECVRLLLAAGCDLGVEADWRRAVAVGSKKALALISAEYERRELASAVGKREGRSASPRI